MPKRHATVVVASSNAGKIAEIAGILGALGDSLVAQSELGIESPPETGSTFAENALIKARHAASLSGLPAIADDSGLAVDALDGRPGIYSARYAGPDATDRQNVDKLLAELDGLGADERHAAFHCVAAFMTPSGDAAPLIAAGRWPGRILEAPRGQGGFGYDPVFYDPVRGMSGAEMSAAEKNRVSHRGEAFRRLAALLRTAGQ